MGLFMRPSELRKARKLPDGTIRNWKGGKYKKVAGKWQPYTEGKKGVAYEGPYDKLDMPKKVKPKYKEGQALLIDGKFKATANGIVKKDPTTGATMVSVTTMGTSGKAATKRMWIGQHRITTGKKETSKAAATIENAKKVLQKNPVSIFALEDLVEYEESGDVKEDYNLSDEQVAALGAISDHVKSRTESGDIPEGMKYFQLANIDGYPVLTVSDIKGFEKMFDWSV